MDTVNNFLEFQHPIWPGLLLAFLLGATLYLSWSPLCQIISYLRLHKLIKRIGHANLENFYLPDGLDSSIYIEHLILQDNGLLLLNIKPYRGNIFAAEKIDQWTQVLGHHSYKFPNPLYQLEADLQCLRAAFPKTDFKGLVVFTRDCNFPKGKPDGVFDFQQLATLTRTSGQNKPSELIQKTWQMICTQAEKATQMKQSIIYSRRDKKRLLLGAMCFGLSICYFAWYMGWVQVVI